MFAKTSEVNSRWNEHAHLVLKEQRAVDLFAAAQTFSSTTGAQGQPCCNPVCTLIFQVLLLRAWRVLNIIVKSDLGGHSITQQTTAAGWCVLVYS